MFSCRQSVRLKWTNRLAFFMFKKQLYMKNLIKILIILCSYGSLFSQNDWNTLPVPANAGEGKVWALQPLSDNFNYTAPTNNKGTEFLSKWTDFYPSAWSGPQR